MVELLCVRRFLNSRKMVRALIVRGGRRGWRRFSKAYRERVGRVCRQTQRYDERVARIEDKFREDGCQSRDFLFTFVFGGVHVGRHGQRGSRAMRKA